MKKTKNICVYSAPLKKNVGYYIRRDCFKNDKEMEDYIKCIKEKHKKENREFKKKRLQERYSLNNPKIDGNKTDDELIPKREDAPLVKKDVRLLFKGKKKDDPGFFPKSKIPTEEKKIMGKEYEILNDIDLLLDDGTGNSTCIFGSSKKGKSTLMMYIYRKFYQKNRNFISSLFATNVHVGVYKNSDKLLKSNVFNKQAEKYIKLQKYINSKTENHYDFLNMFDDVIDTKHKRLINELIMTYRNSNISTIMCLQYGYLLSKMNRANVNNVIIFGSNSNESIEDLINTFLKPYMIRLGFIDRASQVKFFKEITKDHGFFYINNAKDHISFHRIKK